MLRPECRFPISLLMAGALACLFLIAGLDLQGVPGLAHASDGGGNSGSGGGGDSGHAGSGSSGSGSGGDDHSGPGRGGDDDGRGNSGPGGGRDDDGKKDDGAKALGNAADRDGLKRYLEALRRHGKVSAASSSKSSISVSYADGWRETISGDRYRLFDNLGRRVVDRKARQSDYARLRAAAR